MFYLHRRCFSSIRPTSAPTDGEPVDTLRRRAVTVSSLRAGQRLQWEPAALLISIEIIRKMYHAYGDHVFPLHRCHYHGLITSELKLTKLLHQDILKECENHAVLTVL